MNAAAIEQIRAMMMARNQGDQAMPAGAVGGQAGTNPLVAMMAQRRAQMGGMAPQRGQAPGMPATAQGGKGPDMNSLLARAMMQRGQAMGGGQGGAPMGRAYGRPPAPMMDEGQNGMAGGGDWRARPRPML